MQKSASGFVLPVVLGILLVAGLFAATAMSELGTASLLSSQRLLQLRAFEAGESGIVAMLAQLRSGTILAETQTFRSSVPTDFATVQLRPLPASALAAGHSADRVVQREYEIHSTGHSARGATSTLVQGGRRLESASP